MIQDRVQERDSLVSKVLLHEAGENLSRVSGLAAFGIGAIVASLPIALGGVAFCSLSVYINARKNELDSKISEINSELYQKPTISDIEYFKEHIDFCPPHGRSVDSIPREDLYPYQF